MDEKRPSKLSWPSGVFRRYFGDSEPEDASRRTLEIRGMVRHQKKKHRKVFWCSIGVLTVAVAGLGATFFVQAKRLEQQRGAAADLFYAMKEMELEVGRLQVAAPEREESPQHGGAAALLDGSLRGTSTFLVMVATYGIIGDDVRRGYFRFLFAKPISPVLYYAQAFLAALIAFLAVQLIIVAVFALAVEPAWPDRWLLERTAFFLSFGSVIFALSRVLPIDWLIGWLLFGVGSEVRDWYPVSESLRGKIFNVIFPPSHLMESGLFPVEGIEWGHVAWVVG